MNTGTEVISLHKTKQASGASINIPPRRVDFDFSPANVPRYYVDGSPFKTTFVTALSSLFPEGESFFVESVRHYRDRITDPVLKAQVSGFIGQEALHSLAHKAFNDAATAQGFSVDKLDQDVGRLLARGQKILPPSVQLAITACLEHYTAVFTEMFLHDSEFHTTFAPEIRNLYLWHSVEENEHKTVAFDVYENVSGSYALRTATMIPISIIFFGVTFWFQARLMAEDKTLFNVRQNLADIRYLFIGRSGKFSRLLPQYLDWFKPGFHPSQHNTDALLDEWREKLFGKKGLLLNQLRVSGKQKKALEA
jgi:predicted metal-dependent hydrolase